MMTGENNRRALLGIGAAAGAAGIASLASAAGAPSGPAERWQPALEPQDTWMDRPGTRHRLMFDTTTSDAATAAMFYADNFYAANKKGYGLDPAALGVIIVFRHMSTPFGFNDAIWAKYGPPIADMLKMQGKAAIRAAKENPLLTPAASPKPVAKASTPGHEDEPVTLAALARRGTRFAVCATASEGMAGMLAKGSGGEAKAVLAEMTANMIPGAVMVPAGIVAVNRAQEHGYAFVNIPE